MSDPRWVLASADEGQRVPAHRVRSTPETSKRPPNVLLINCDDLGYGDLGCYGSPVNQTPSIDGLAAQGIRFTDFYAPAPVCSPSRGGMLTGCYPPRIGFGSFEGRAVLWPGQGVGLSSEETTIASMLKARGYATGMIGKWHCGDQPEFLPTSHGFDHYYGLPYSNDMGRGDDMGRFAAKVGATDLPPLPLLRDTEVIQEQPDQTSLTERYVEEAVRFMRENRQTPFFLYFAHMYVHLPLYVPERFLRDAANGPYGAAVECIDWATSVLLGELERLGLAENTLVVFTSDNGSNSLNGGSNAPLHGRKAWTWEGGMRVPCLMRWPGTISPGQVSSDLVTALDFLPTFASVAGVELPTDRVIDGQDITGILVGAGQRPPTERPFFYYFKDQLEAVRVGRWKLQVRRRQDEVRELYDLIADIGETQNVLAQHPEVVEALERQLAACREDIGDDATGVLGASRRPAGRVEDPKPLTEFDPTHPYLVAMYDLPGEP